MRGRACIVADIMKTVSTMAGAREEQKKRLQPGDHHQRSAAPLPDLPPREVLDTAGDLLRALAAPVRIALLLQLRESSRCVHELVDALEVPQPLVSQHLRILRPRVWWPASALAARSCTGSSITTSPTSSSPP